VGVVIFAHGSDCVEVRVEICILATFDEHGGGLDHPRF
jgi:hypothetical protein